MDKAKNMQGKTCCEVCGQNQDRCFEVHVGGEKHIFDSFECAIRGLMPTCNFCGGLILGPGIQIGNIRVCSNVCASLYSTQEIYIMRDMETRRQKY